MKKFPEIDEYYIKQLSNSDPSGKNAYLMWMAQALKDAGAGIYTVPGLASEKVIEIVPLVNDFHKAKQRISQLNKQRKKDGKTLYPNDINQFGSLEDLEDFLDELGISGSEKKKEKGSSTWWCYRFAQTMMTSLLLDLTQKNPLASLAGHKVVYITDPKGQNYYDTYTRQGKAFYFVLNKHLPGKVNKKKNWKEGDNPLAKEGHPGSTYKKLALVYDKSGQLEEWFDAPDQSHDSEYELANVLLYNIIAPALAQSGKLEYGGAPLEMSVPTDGMDDFEKMGRKQERETTSLIDGIAAALRGEECLEDFLGSDDPEKCILLKSRFIKALFLISKRPVMIFLLMWMNLPEHLMQRHYMMLTLLLKFLIALQINTVVTDVKV